MFHHNGQKTETFQLLEYKDQNLINLCFDIKVYLQFCNTLKENFTYQSPLQSWLSV